MAKQNNSNPVLFPEIGELKPGEKMFFNGSTVQRVPGGVIWYYGSSATYVPFTELAAAECGLEVVDAREEEIQKGLAGN